MRLISAVGTALSPLLRRPIRTLLLLQGTVWGVAVAVFPSAVIEGTRQAALARGATLGADRISIAADPTAPEPSPLTTADVDALDRHLRGDGTDAARVGGVRVVTSFGERGTEGALVEATPDALAARGLQVAEGRWLSADDDAHACFVEAGFGAAVGEEVRIPLPAAGEATFTVVGVAKPQSAARLRTNDLGFDVTHPMYGGLARGILVTLGIPIVEDAWKRSDGVVYVRGPPAEPAAEVDWILIRVEASAVKEVARRAEAHLVARGRSPITLHPLVLPVVMGEEVDRFHAVQTALFLACLAMGAVVMANLGLLTVLTRRAEIAIRRVEGATRRTIAAHFLLEGLVLSSVGCVIGCGLGMALAALRVALSPVTGFAWVFPIQHALIAVGVALAIGVLAALLPAVRASYEDPVAGLVEE